MFNKLQLISSQNWEGNYIPCWCHHTVVMSSQSLATDFVQRSSAPGIKLRFQGWETYLVFNSWKKKPTKHKGNARFYLAKDDKLLFGNSVIPILFLTEARKIMTSDETLLRFAWNLWAYNRYRFYLAAKGCLLQNSLYFHWFEQAFDWLNTVRSLLKYFVTNQSCHA